MELSSSTYKVFWTNIEPFPIWEGFSLDEAQDIAQSYSGAGNSIDDCEIFEYCPSGLRRCLAQAHKGRLSWRVNNC